MSVPTASSPSHQNSPLGAGPGELPPPPFAPALAEELVRRLAKTLRTRTLYLPNNPVYRGAIDGLRDILKSVWAEADQVTLSVTESEIRWEGRVIATEQSRQEGLPWLLFKDGVRELTLLPGVEGGELEQLLDILVRARKAAPEEDDLLTLLWEQEFLFLRYRFVDLSLDALCIEAPEQHAEETRNVGNPRDIATEESPNPNIVSMDDLDASIYFLEEHEIDYLRSEVATEERTRQHMPAIAALLDVFETRQEPDVRLEIASAVEALVPQLLSMSEYGAAAYLLRESREAVNRATNVADEVREVMSRIPARLSSPDVLPQLIRSLDESDTIPPQEDLGALFAELRGETLALILGAIPQTQTPRLKGALEAAGARLAAVNTAELVRLILAPSKVIALQAIRRAGDLATPAAVGPLGKILAANDVELRQAAAQSLASIGSPGAIRTIEPAMEDEDREVRITALRAVGARQHRAALPQIDAAIRGRAARAADLTEKMAWFEAYAALAGTDGIEVLGNLLEPGGGFFSRRADPEVRACAAMALGRIGTEAALARLRAAVSEKDVLVRSSINKALRGAGGG